MMRRKTWPRVRPLAIAILVMVSFAAATSSLAASLCKEHDTTPRGVYEQHCQSCHGEAGRPMDAGTPDFSRGERLFVSDTTLLGKVRSGSGSMPAYRGLLTDDEIRDVVAYLRTLQR